MIILIFGLGRQLPGLAHSCRHGVVSIALSLTDAMPLFHWVCWLAGG